MGQNPVLNFTNGDEVLFGPKKYGFDQLVWFGPLVLTHLFLSFFS